jgi:environmental stress-induced protein Ves
VLERIPANAYREAPWKNGGGLTREIAAEFLDDAGTHLGWRISIATIDRDGPFSEFRGYHRTIVALDGDPVELDIDGTRVLLQLGEPVEFSGEARVACRLTASRARDLNVMTLRSAYVHDLEIVTAPQRFVLDEDEIAFVVALDAPAEVDGEPCAAGDTIEIDEVESFEVRTAGHAAVVRITEL